MSYLLIFAPYFAFDIGTFEHWGDDPLFSIVFCLFLAFQLLLIVFFFFGFDGVPDWVGLLLMTLLR